MIPATINMEISNVRTEKLCEAGVFLGMWWRWQLIMFNPNSQSVFAQLSARGERLHLVWTSIEGGVLE